MSKKNWIFIKRGLSQDPKHRETMGNAIWVYMHILDRADWETGIVYDWKDEAEADDMGINIRTMRKWRQELNEAGYISCKQEQYGQQITIHNWVNPRNYSGEVLNQKQGDTKSVPQKSQGDTQGDTQGSINRSTPTSSSLIINSLSVEKIEKSANRTVDAILENERKAQQKNHYSLREKFPEVLVGYSDVYVQLSGQKPSKRTFMDWLSTFQDWLDEGLQAKDVQAAYSYATRPNGGFLVGRPGSLTNTAVALKSKPSNSPHIRVEEVNKTKDMIDQRESRTYVPRPDSVAKPKLMTELLKGS